MAYSNTKAFKRDLNVGLPNSILLTEES